MLVAALGLTILGFAFLVAAVATGQIAWARSPGPGRVSGSAPSGCCCW